MFIAKFDYFFTKYNPFYLRLTSSTMSYEPTEEIARARNQLILQRLNVPAIVKRLRLDVENARNKVNLAGRKLTGAWSYGRSKYEWDEEHDYLTKCERLAKKAVRARRTSAELYAEIDQKLANLDREQEAIWRDVPLWNAAQAGNVDAIKKALASGTNPNTTRFSTYSPLAIAVRNVHPEAVYYLLSVMVNPNICAESKTNPLKLAVETGQYDVAVRLVNAKAKLDWSIYYNINEKLCTAIVKNNVVLADQLLRIKASIRQYLPSGESALHTAARLHHLEMVKRLIEHKADVNKESRVHQLPLTAAVRTGCTKVVSALLEAKADVNAYSRGQTTPLSTAIHCSYKTMRVLLGAKADPNQGAEYYTSPLHLAVDCARLNAIRTLLYAKADINITERVTNARPIDQVQEGLNAEKIRRLLTGQ